MKRTNGQRRHSSVWHSAWRLVRYTLMVLLGYLMHV